MRIYDKKTKRGQTYEAHTSPTKYGMGDYYGTSMKAPMGKMRDSSVGYRPVNSKQLKTKPKNLAQIFSTYSSDMLEKSKKFNK